MSFCWFAPVDSTTFLLSPFCIIDVVTTFITSNLCILLYIQVPNEQLFETMDKTLHLLEMGFSNDEISMAIEKIGEQLRRLSVQSMTIIFFKETI